MPYAKGRVNAKEQNPQMSCISSGICLECLPHLAAGSLQGQFPLWTRKCNKG